ncbi:MAG: methyltransferase domain-containing protein [Vicinamibacterales bacterium]
MKHIVVFDDLHEFDIRPQASYAEFVRLLETEVRREFDPATFRGDADCPACASADTAPVFAKWEFAYRRCPVCATVFGSPGPDAMSLERFRSSSAALDFWRRTMLEHSAEARAGHLFRPRLNWMLDLVSRHRMQSGSVADYGARHPGMVRELVRSGQFDRVLAVPSAPETWQAFEDAGATPVSTLDAGSITALTAFESLEGEPDLRVWFETFGRAVKPGGLLFLTMRAGSGFDMQILGGRAPNLLPPLHRVLPSPEGIAALLAAHGFEALEISTPGQLDVQIVAATIAQDPGVQLPPFVDTLMRRGPRVQEAFQEFLQTSRLSSHMRVAALRMP